MTWYDVRLSHTGTAAVRGATEAGAAKAGVAKVGAAVSRVTSAPTAADTVRRNPDVDIRSMLVATHVSVPRSGEWPRPTARTRGPGCHDRHLRPRRSGRRSGGGEGRLGAVEDRLVGGGPAGGPALRVGAAHRTLDQAREVLVDRRPHGLVTGGEDGQQVRRTGRTRLAGRLLRGAGQPLPDPHRVRRQEGLPERARPRPSRRGLAGPRAYDRGGRLYVQRHVQ